MPLTVLATNPNADLYGASRMMLESVKGFRDEDWEVTVSVPATAGPLIDEVEALGARFRPCPTPVLRKGYLSPVGLLRLVGQTLRSILPGVRLIRSVRPDVLYANTIIEPLWLVLAWVLRVPVLCHVHEGEAGASPLLRRALALPLLLARRLMVNSRFSLDVLTATLPRLADRCEVVYNGVDGPPSPPSPPRAELTPPVRLLYVGRLSERKGVADAVDALAELDRRGITARLEVVGSVFPGYEWVEDDLRARAAASGAADRVCFHGFSADVWGHLDAADVLVVPSRLDEPFGNNAVEGALAARPVVASRTSGLVEATRSVEAVVLVEPGDPAALAAGVAEVVARWPRLAPLAAAGAPRTAEAHAPETYRSHARRLVRASAERTAGGRS